MGRSHSAPQTLVDVVGTQGDAIKQAIASRHATAVSTGGSAIAMAPLDGLADGGRAVVVASAPAAIIPDAAALSMPIIWGMLLGIVMVVAGGYILGSYIDRPINMLEEGLLAILNGQSDKRFELEHAELGRPCLPD